MIIMGIDPGPEVSHYAICEKKERKPSFLKGGHFMNNSPSKNKNFIRDEKVDLLVIEMVKNYGMPMSDHVLATCAASGAYAALGNMLGICVRLVPRKTIVTALCGSARANDANVRSFLTDYWLSLFDLDGLGGGQNRLVGTSKDPGPFSGFRGKANSDKWAALACATYELLGSEKVRDADEWL